MLSDKPLIWKDIAQLPFSERDRRWSTIWQKMDEAGFGCLLVWPGKRGEHMRYVSQLPVKGVALVLPKKGPIIFTDGLIASHYARYCHNWVEEVRDDIENLPRVLKDLGLDGATIGMVTMKNPHSRLQQEGGLSGSGWIQGALPRAKLIDATRLLQDMEMIKSSAEMEFLHRAAEIAYDVFEAMADAMRPGATEQEIYSRMLAAQTATGGDITDIWLDVSSPPRLHGRYPPYSARKIQKGDVLITEYHASYGGYLVATEHTISLGQPPEALCQVHRVAEECFREGTASMVVGAKFSDVIAAYRTPADRAEMAYVELGIHGHGLMSCEFPTTVFGGKGGMLHHHQLAQIPDVALQENMVFGQNIDVHNPKWNPNAGVMLGNTIWVAKEGPKALSRVPTELTVV
jgi:Xaa-Pro dipeptidase